MAEAVRLYAIIGAAIDEFAAKMDEADRRLDQFVNGPETKAKIGADSDALTEQMDDIERQLDELEEKPTEVRIEADVAAAQAGLGDVAAQLEDLDKTTVTAKVEVETEAWKRDFEEMEKGVEDIGKEADDAAEFAEGSFATAFEGVAGNLEKTVGGAFNKLKARFLKGIVLTVTAVGIEKVQQAVEDLKGVADAASLPEGVDKWAAQVATLDKAIAEAKANSWNPFSMITPDMLTAAEAARQKLLDQIAATKTAGAATREFIAAERDRASLAAGTAATQSDINPLGGVVDKIEETLQAASDAGRRLPRVFADGILDARQAPVDALDELKALMKGSMSETAETTRLLGQLASDELAKGMTDKDPAVRNAAAGARNTIINRLEDLAVTPGTLTSKGMDALKAAMESKDPVIKAAATQIYNSVKGMVPSDAVAKGWGGGLVAAYAQGMRDNVEKARAAGIAVSEDVANIFRTASPPGPQSPLHKIDEWGRKTGLAWVDGLIEGLESGDGRTKLTLSKVQGEFEKFVRSYDPIGNQIGAASPEGQKHALEGYIASLTKQLESSADPEERYDLLRQITKYTARLESLEGKTARPEELAIDKLIGYISVLDKRLLTEADPKKRQDLIDEIVEYLGRIDDLRDRMAAQDAAAEQAAGDATSTTPSPTDSGSPPPPRAAGPSGTVKLEVEFNPPAPAIIDPQGIFMRQLAEALLPGIIDGLRAAGYETSFEIEHGESHAHSF